MKPILILILVLSSCTPPAAKTDSFESISFTSITRGGQKTITVSAGKVMFVRNGEEWQQALPPEIWAEIVTALEAINLPEIENYKSPTHERYTDGAWHSTLAVVSEGVTYESASFDNTNAPAQLVLLLKAVLELDEEYNSGKKRLYQQK